VASVLGLDLNNKAAKARVQGLLRVWEENGALRIEERRDKATRQEKKFVAVGRWAMDAAATPAASVALHATAVEHQSATLHPAPYRGAGVAAGAAVEGAVSQRHKVAAGHFPHGNPAFKLAAHRDPFNEAEWPE
jgi:hypothetical protein